MLNPGVGLAATGLIMGATGTPEPSSGEMQKAMQYYLDPLTSCKVAVCSLTAVVTPEQLWPVPGWGDLTYDQSVAIGVDNLDAAIRAQLAADPTGPVVVFGSSQSAAIVALEQHLLADQPQSVKDRVTFVVTGDPNRPNGGLLARFYPLTVPSIGFTFNGPAPTDTGFTTYDIVFEYDAAGDFPRYPLNVFTIANILAGALIHSSYLTYRDGYTDAELQQAINDPANRQTYGDTVYITIPTKELPLTQLIKTVGTALGASSLTTPLADLLDPTLRVLVDLGYDRTTPYGQPAPVGLFNPIDPAKLAAELVAAGQQGIQAATADLRGNPHQPPTVPAAGNATAAPGRAVAHSAASTIVPSTSTTAPSAGTTTPSSSTTVPSTSTTGTHRNPTPPKATTKPSGARETGMGGPRRTATRP
ncbi:PE-PPE domain-containing protein [Mycolicibacterium sp. CH28]|uniref:PE-PPE domain-containing protein n=1 Tax=Mycolicibacterium sp. CH28 TaxID=2512237 RepID=UPI0013868B56|nr:PE-PPE domain-containing protein [Mycolicibacterium sp. CH28]